MKTRSSIYMTLTPEKEKLRYHHQKLKTLENTKNQKIPETEIPSPVDNITAQAIESTILQTVPRSRQISPQVVLSRPSTFSVWPCHSMLVCVLRPTWCNVHSDVVSHYFVPCLHSTRKFRNNKMECLHPSLQMLQRVHVCISVCTMNSISIEHYWIQHTKGWQ